MIESAAKLTVGNAFKASQGEETSVGSDAASLVKPLIPFSNLWWGSAVFNNLWIRYIQEYLKPGYAAKLEARAQREFGIEYWWHPGELSPSEAPDLGKIVGE